MECFNSSKNSTTVFYTKELILDINVPYLLLLLDIHTAESPIPYITYLSIDIAVKNNT